MKTRLIIIMMLAVLPLLASNEMQDAANEELVSNESLNNASTSGITSEDQKVKTFMVNGVSFKMIRVEGGSFTMGATSEQGNDARVNEKPTHNVTLSTYYIGETEVTQELWQAVMGSNPSYNIGSRKPVEFVSWNDCQDFVTRLNALTGSNFRLPTEAEWEFAARGGNNSRGYKYAGSNTIGDVAWYLNNSNFTTHNVAQKSPNELGLYDMSGNVWEWCQDWYDDYSNTSQTNPIGPSSGAKRVNRGGGWDLGESYCRVSIRGGITPDDYLYYFLGLRLALPVVERNNTLTVDKSSMSFDASGGSDSFTITSNTSWTVTSDQSWCTVSTSYESGNELITVYVSENASTDSRYVTITVKADNITQIISVTQTGATPSNQSTRTFTVNGVSFKMICVEGGTFTMGATSEQGSDAFDREKPTHSVTLSSFYIGETEVTQELWQAVMGSNPSSFNGSQKPVENVCWNDCLSFIAKLNALTGEKFRLPTEAEWEFAARGGRNSRGYKYSGSNTIDDVAWYRDNSNSETHNVAQKLPNELGLYDMNGNVDEWCKDWFASYSSSSQSNPTGPGRGYSRVHRGGCWIGEARSCRVSCRYLESIDHKSNLFGLRLAQ